MADVLTFGLKSIHLFTQRTTDLFTSSLSAQQTSLGGWHSTTHFSNTVIENSKPFSAVLDKLRAILSE